MPIKRSIALAVLASALVTSGPLLATTSTADVSAQVIAKVTTPLLNQLPIFNPAPMLAQSAVPTQIVAPAAQSNAPASETADADDNSADGDQTLDLRKTF